MNNDPIQYDDDEAVKFIKNQLPQELKSRFTNDEINYIIDVVYDFYDSKGLMNDDVNENDLVDINSDEIIEFVSKNVRKDKIFEFTEDEIRFVVHGEIDYCESLGLYEE